MYNAHSTPVVQTMLTYKSVTAEFLFNISDLLRLIIGLIRVLKNIQDCALGYKGEHECFLEFESMNLTTLKTKYFPNTYLKRNELLIVE